jgi:diguanylate cyclase (GGDEF)-like protein
MLHRVSSLVRSSVEFEPTCRALLTGVTAGSGLGFNRAMVFLLDPGSRSLLRGEAAVGPVDGAEAERVWRSTPWEEMDLEEIFDAGQRSRGRGSTLDSFVRRMVIDARGESPVALALRNGSMAAGRGRDDLDGFLHLPTAVAAPLRGREEVHGVLYADDPFTGRIVDGIVRHVFCLLADQAGRAIDNAREYERVAHAARTDALTRLANHGALMDDLSAACGVAVREGQSLGVVMFDLDGFKEINDRHGHLAGDEVLAALSGRVRDVLRAGEKLYRYGGEEFVVMLPGADDGEADRVAERIRLALAGAPFVLEGGLEVSVTCSAGVATLSGDASDAGGLLELADRALLRAKVMGKNCMQHAPSHAGLRLDLRPGR